MHMRQDTAVDGFRLAYERTGPEAGAPTVLLLHGWPGDRTDYREVVPLVSGTADVVVPDLRGFGESDKHEADPASQYTAAAQARSLVGLIEDLKMWTTARTDRQICLDACGTYAGTTCTFDGVCGN